MKEECIPVGCVLPTHWPYLIVSEKTEKTMHAAPEQPHMPPQSNHACSPQSNHTHPPSNHAHPPQSNHACPPRATTHAPPEQPHTPRSNHAPPQSNHACPPQSNHVCPPKQPRMPSPMNRMTNWCKNITLPQTSFAGSNDRMLAKISKKLQIKWNFELTVFELTVPDLYS